jgi:acyl-CoA thioesterase 11/acyl-coenzyme A thioesterase 9
MPNRYFVVLNLDDEDPTKYKYIERGLVVDEADQEQMKFLLKAHRRWQFEKEEQHLLRLSPLGLSL